jgi:hypothetical protein
MSNHNKKWTFRLLRSCGLDFEPASFWNVDVSVYNRRDRPTWFYYGLLLTSSSIDALPPGRYDVRIRVTSIRISNDQCVCTIPLKMFADPVNQGQVHLPSQASPPLQIRSPSIHPTVDLHLARPKQQRMSDGTRADRLCLKNTVSGLSFTTVTWTGQLASTFRAFGPNSRVHVHLDLQLCFLTVTRGTVVAQFHLKQSPNIRAIRIEKNPDHSPRHRLQQQYRAELSKAPVQSYLLEGHDLRSQMARDPNLRLEHLVSDPPVENKWELPFGCRTFTEAVGAVTGGGDSESSDE